MARSKLEFSFKNSHHHLSQKSFFRVYQFNHLLSRAKKRISEIIDNQILFYKELSRDTITLNRVLDLGGTVYSIKERLDKELKTLMNESRVNKELLILIANYKLNIKREHPSLVHNFKDLIGFADHDRHQEELMGNSEIFSLYRSENLFIFSRLTKKAFCVDKHSSNAAGYFGYSEQGFKGLRLGNLMPASIARHHEKYLTDFVNQTKEPMRKATPLISFAVTKNKVLKKLFLMPKLEFLLSDDVYLAALMIPAKMADSAVSVVLGEKGRVLTINEPAKRIFGDLLFTYPYALYYLMPGLIEMVYGSEETYEDGQAGLRAESEFVGKTRNQEMFYFGNMLSGELFEDFNSRYSPMSPWSCLEMSKQKIHGMMRRVKDSFFLHKANFIKRFEEVQRVDASYDLYEFKEGVKLRFIKLDNFKALNQHHKRFLRVYTKRIDTNSAKMLSIEPKNLCYIKMLLKRRREVDQLTMKLFKALMKSHLAHIFNGKSPNIGASLINAGKRSSQFNNGVPHSSPRKINKDILKDFGGLQPQIQFKKSGVDSGEDSDEEDLSSLYDPVTYRVEHSIKPIPSYRNKKFKWKRKAKNQKESNQKSYEGKAGREYRPNETIERSYALLPRPSEADRSFNFIDRNFKRSIAAQLNMLSRVKQKLNGFRGARNSAPKNLSVTSAIARLLNNRILKLKNEVDHLKSVGKESQINRLMDSFSERDLKKIFTDALDQKKKLNQKQKKEKKRGKNDLLKKLFLKKKEQKFYEMEDQGSISGSVKSKNNKSSRLFNHKQSKVSVTDSEDFDTRGNHNRALQMEIHNKKSLKTHQGSIRNNISNKRLRSKIRRLKLTKLTKRQPTLFFVVLILVCVVAGYLKQAVDTQFKSAMFSGQSSLKLVWLAISSGKMLKILVRNKMAIAGMANPRISQNMPSYLVRAFKNITGGFEASLYSYPTKTRRPNSFANGSLKHNNNKIWEDSIVMRLPNKTSNSFEEYKVTLGELLNTILYQKIQFYSTYTPSEDRFEDIDELDSEALWLNIAEANHKILEKLTILHQSEDIFQRVLLTYTTIEAISFIAASLVLGFFFFLIFLRVENLKLRVQRFFLKMDRKLLAKELTRLQLLGDAEQKMFSLRMGVIRLSDEEEKKIETLFAQSKLRKALEKDKSRVKKRSAKVKLLNIKYNYSRFSHKLGSKNLQIASISLVIVLLINIPVGVNYAQFLRAGATIQQVSFLKHQTQLRMAFNNIVFAIELLKYYKLYQLRHQAQEKDPPTYSNSYSNSLVEKSLLDLKLKISPYFKSNFYKENSGLFRSLGIDQFLTRDYCAKELAPMKRNEGVCRFVTNGQQGFDFGAGYNQMLAYYSRLKLNQGNLGFIDSKEIWVNENIADFNLVHSIEADIALEMKLDETLGVIDARRVFLFYIMLGCLFLILFGYRFVFYSREQREWALLMNSLMVCSDELILSNSGLRSFFGSASLL